MTAGEEAGSADGSMRRGAASGSGSTLRRRRSSLFQAQQRFALDQERTAATQNPSLLFARPGDIAEALDQVPPSRAAADYLSYDALFCAGSGAGDRATNAGNGDPASRARASLIAAQNVAGGPSSKTSSKVKSTLMRALKTSSIAPNQHAALHRHVVLAPTAALVPLPAALTRPATTTFLPNRPPWTATCEPVAYKRPKDEAEAFRQLRSPPPLEHASLSAFGEEGLLVVFGGLKPAVSAVKRLLTSGGTAGGEGDVSTSPSAAPSTSTQAAASASNDVWIYSHIDATWRLVPGTTVSTPTAAGTGAAPGGGGASGGGGGLLVLASSGDKAATVSPPTGGSARHLAASCPAPRAGHCAVAVGDIPASGALAAEREVAHWKGLATMKASEDAAAVALEDVGGRDRSIDGRCPRLIVFGGASVVTGRCYNDVWEFDVRKGCWSVLHDGTMATQKRSATTHSQSGVVAVPPTPRWKASSAVLDDRLFVFGGEGSDFEVFGDLHVFDLTHRYWRAIRRTEPTPSPRYMQACCTVGDKMIVCGGIGPAGHGVPILDTTWCLEMRTLLWRPIAPSGHAADPTPTSPTAYGMETQPLADASSHAPPLVGPWAVKATPFSLTCHQSLSTWLLHLKKGATTAASEKGGSHLDTAAPQGSSSPPTSLLPNLEAPRPGEGSPPFASPGQASLVHQRTSSSNFEMSPAASPRRDPSLTPSASEDISSRPRAMTNDLVSMEGHVLMPFDDMIVLHGGAVGPHRLPNQHVFVLDLIREQWYAAQMAPSPLIAAAVERRESLTTASQFPCSRAYHAACAVVAYHPTVSIEPSVMSVDALQRNGLHLTDAKAMRRYIQALESLVAQQHNVVGVLSLHHGRPVVGQTITCAFIGGVAVSQQGGSSGANGALRTAGAGGRRLGDAWVLKLECTALAETPAAEHQGTTTSDLP